MVNIPDITNYSVIRKSDFNYERLNHMCLTYKNNVVIICGYVFNGNCNSCEM